MPTHCFNSHVLTGNIDNGGQSDEGKVSTPTSPDPSTQNFASSKLCELTQASRAIANLEGRNFQNTVKAGMRTRDEAETEKMKLKPSQGVAQPRGNRAVARLPDARQTCQAHS